MSLTRKLTSPLTRPVAIASGATAESDNVVKSGSYKSFTPTFVGDKSIKFDGTDDVITTSADSTLATKTYSFWAKSTKTSFNTVFDHGDANKGGFQFNGSSGRALLYLANSYYRYFDNTPCQDDGLWHHWLLLLTTDVSNSRLFCDGVEIAANFTSTSAGAALAYSTGIRIGQGGSYYFNGSLDEFAIFNGDQSALADTLYNNGQPTNLSSYSTLDHWFRMGEGKLGSKSDGDENLLFDQGPNGGLGSEKISDGGFSDTLNWLELGDAVVENGVGTFPTATSNSFIIKTGAVPATVAVYKLQYDVVSTNGNTLQLAGGSSAFPTTALASSVGTHSVFVTSNGTNTNLQFNNNSSFIGSIDNVSVKEVQNVGTISGAAIQADRPQELITNGTYDTDTTGWTPSSDTTLSVVSGKLRVTSSSSYKYAYQSFATRIDGVYSFSVTGIKGTSPNYNAYFGNGINGATVLYPGTFGTTDSLGDSQIISGTFTATATTTFLTLRSRNEGSVTDAFTEFDNISVKEVTESVPKQTQNLPSGASKKSMAFDGTDDLVDLGASSTFFSTNVNSISMWFKMPDTSGGAERIFVSNSDAGGSDLRVVVSTSGIISVDIWNGSGLVSTTGGSAIDDDIWHHLAYTTNASAQALYIDGVSVATTTHTRSSRAGSVSATIASHVTSNIYSDVDVDEVAIWDTALDGDAIRALYNAGLPTPVTTKTGAYDIYKDNLKAYYKMGDASDPAADGTSNLLFDQTNPGVGPELVKTNPFVSGSWSGYSANVVTFPSTTTVRVERPTSGGSSQGAAADLNTTILQSTPAAGTTLKISFDLNTDDSNVQAQIYNGSASSYSTGGSGSKTVFVTMTGAGFIRFVGLDSDKFVELSNLTIREVNGHTGTISGATIQTEAPKAIYALAPVDNKFSLNFDGTNDHLVTQVDATAQPNNESRYYSFWAKSTLTSSNRVFHHGDFGIGGFAFNHSSNRPLLYMAATVFRFWNDNSAQDDGNWHHWVVKIKYNDITGCELWCDGVKQTVNEDSNIGSMNTYTTGIRIGRAGTGYFNGSMDEFSIHEDLDDEAIRALFNRGRPIDISKSQGAYDLSDKALHWWRMGDAPGGQIGHSGDVLFQGLQAESDELVPNGDLSTWTDTDTIATWTHKDSNNDGGGGVISQVGSGEGSGGTGLGSANYFTASATNMSLTSGTISEAGRTYRLEIEVSRYVQGIIRVQGAVAQDFGASDIVDGKIVKIFTATSATYIRVQGSNACDFTVDNVSLKQLRGQYIGTELITNGDYSDASVPDTFNGSSQVNLAGWTSGGSTHTADAHFVITNGACQMDTDGTNVTISQGATVVGKAYQYSLEITDYVTGGMTVAAGGVTVQANITSNGTYTGVFVATGTTAIDISRKFGAAAKMTIDNVSVKEIVGAASMTNMDPGSDIVTDTPY